MVPLAIVIVSILFDMAVGDCTTFPKQMEGNIELYGPQSLYTTFYDGARFTVDYKDKMSAIIRHPTNDEVYIRQDFRNLKKYHKHQDGSCSEMTLPHDEIFYMGIPSTATKTTFDLTASGNTAEEFIFKDGDGYTYIVVTKATCVPKLVKRYFYNISKTTSQVFSHVNTTISDSSILDKKC